MTARQAGHTKVMFSQQMIGKGWATIHLIIAKPIYTDNGCTAVFLCSLETVENSVHMARLANLMAVERGQGDRKNCLKIIGLALFYL